MREISDPREYRDALRHNLETMSRTAAGTVDAGASPEKARVFRSGLDVGDVADRARRNADRAFDLIWSLREHRWSTAAEVRDFVTLLWHTLNGGIVANDAPMLRGGSDSLRHPNYTAVADVPAAFGQFCEELAARLVDPDQDPVRLAAWIEYRVNFTDHFFSDGCGRVSVFLASWALMRRGLSLPVYGSRETHYAQAPRTRRDLNAAAEDDAAFTAFSRYYAGLFEEEEAAEPAVREGILAYEFEVELETRYLIEPLCVEDFAWKNHVIDTYDRSGRARIRVKNGKPRFSVKIPLFTRDTETVKACLRLELKPRAAEQEKDLLWLRDLILREAGAQRVEKWGAEYVLPDGQKVWLNRDSLGNWWFEVDDGAAFELPPGVRLIGRAKSAIDVGH